MHMDRSRKSVQRQGRGASVCREGKGMGTRVQDGETEQEYQQVCGGREREKLVCVGRLTGTIVGVPMYMKKEKKQASKGREKKEKKKLYGWGGKDSCV